MNDQGREVPVMDFDELQAYLTSQKEKIVVVNFWATWCAPCVEELHYFEYANRDFKDQDVKVILVSLDFRKAMESQLLPFLKRNEIESEVILLSDPRTNTWINRVSPDWSGAIPGTWFIAGDSAVFDEGKYPDYQVLKNTISTLKKI
jgi:thiol-disulfide isomerase/thioredoxin